MFFFAPKILEALKLQGSNPEAAEFFKNLFQDMVDRRKTEKESRKDFLDLLIQLMNKNQISDNRGSILKNTDNYDGDGGKNVEKSF